MGLFKGRIAVVTGAAKGIGAEIAHRFFREEADMVFMLDVDGEAAVRTARQIDFEGKRVKAIQCDVSDPSSVEQAFAQIIPYRGAVDILVNNAGITRDAMAHRMTCAQFDQVVKVSLYGSFYCISQVLPGMRNQAYGKIISMSSLASRGNVGQVNYSAAKAAIIGMTKTLALENGAKGISVNCIAPGMIYTDIIKTVPEDIQNSMKASIPMKDFGRTEDVAALVSFLASDEASYISGQCIKLTGGGM